jgi:alanine racemase
MLRAVAEVNLAAIERNVRHLRSLLAEKTRMCAVVKADGYGHGAEQSARAALAGGASLLAVATVAEAVELRDRGISEPVLVLGAISREELPLALAAEAELVAWDPHFVAELNSLIHRRGSQLKPVPIHVKLDSGLGRLGTRDAGQALAVARAVLDAAPVLRLVAVMTHFATADGDQEFVAEQLRVFKPFVAAVQTLTAGGIYVHAANSAATILTPASHFDLVRCGIAIYGGDPMNVAPAGHGLEPALALRSYVAAVKQAAVGDSAGYGRRWIAERETWVATIPIGYGDGFSRALSNNCEVLIGGRRYPLVGTVSMDNITVELGPEDPEVKIGDPVTLIGAQGDELITGEELAGRLGTISYEVFCRISARVPRRYLRDGAPA